MDINFYRAQLYEDEVETWILIGDPSCKHPSIHCKRCKTIVRIYIHPWFHALLIWFCCKHFQFKSGAFFFNNWWPVSLCLRWTDIQTDLNNEAPFYLNIRQLHKGILQRNVKKTGGNLHCIMAFQKRTWHHHRKPVAAVGKRVFLDEEESQSNGDLTEEHLPSDSSDS